VTTVEEKAAPEKFLDPRILRTRKLLREAMVGLLECEPFDSISVQAIGEWATVNRATFFAHYVDREALLEDVVQSRLEEVLEVRPVRFEGTCPSALRVVILAVYDFLVEMASGCGKQRRHFEPFVQSVVQMQWSKWFRRVWIRACSRWDGGPSLAAALSWAIYGAAISALRSGDSKDGRAAITALRSAEPGRHRRFRALRR